MCETLIGVAEAGLEGFSRHQDSATGELDRLMPRWRASRATLWSGRYMDDTRRLEAFSDGVMAVAITLLILSVKDPGTPHTTLAHRLLHLWPSYMSYAISFIIIGIIWVNHHDVFKEIKVVDRTMQFINLFLLMTAVAIPFPTSLLADHLGEGNADSHTAAFAYGLVMTAMGGTFLLLWVHAARHPSVLVENRKAEYAWRRARQSGVALGISATGALVGLLNAPAGLGVSALVGLYFARSRRHERSAEEP